MGKIITLKNNENHTVLCVNDFAELLFQQLGLEAKIYFEECVSEVEDAESQIRILESRVIELEYENNDLQDENNQLEDQVCTQTDQLKAQQLVRRSENKLDESTLFDFFISSVDGTQEPIWTEEHISELLYNFDVIEKRKEVKADE